MIRLPPRRVSVLVAAAILLVTVVVVWLAWSVDMRASAELLDQ
jgi:hypothetical protein